MSPLYFATSLITAWDASLCTQACFEMGAFNRSSLMFYTNCETSNRIHVSINDGPSWPKFQCLWSAATPAASNVNCSSCKLPRLLMDAQSPGNKSSEADVTKMRRYNRYNSKRKHFSKDNDNVWWPLLLATVGTRSGYWYYVVAFWSGVS